jgi:hypothetical protein
MPGDHPGLYSVFPTLPMLAVPIIWGHLFAYQQPVPHFDTYEHENPFAYAASLIQLFFSIAKRPSGMPSGTGYIQFHGRVTMEGAYCYTWHSRLCCTVEENSAII